MTTREQAIEEIVSNLFPIEWRRRRVQALFESRDEARAEIRKLQSILDGLVECIAKQSELLTREAEKQ